MGGSIMLISITPIRSVTDEMLGFETNRHMSCVLTGQVTEKIIDHLYSALWQYVLYAEYPARTVWLSFRGDLNVD